MKNEWKWFGHPGHFICARDCRFHLCTQIGEFLISTVGEYWPDRTVREIFAKSGDAEWFNANRHLRGDAFDNAYMKRFGFEDIGYKRKYETMVFRTNGRVCTAKACACGLPEIIPTELDAKHYNEAGAATTGHYELCERWQNGKPEDVEEYA